MYFIGKSLWAKGYAHLITLLQQLHSNKDGSAACIHVDMYGSGPDRYKQLAILYTHNNTVTTPFADQNGKLTLQCTAAHFEQV